MTISEMQPGQRFRAGEEPPYLTGVLVRLGPGSAIVRFDGEKRRTIEVRRGREIVRRASFAAPLRPVAVSLGMEVQPLQEEAQDAVYGGA